MTITHRYIKRLVEVDLPIRRISIAAAEEKESRTGHIPRMHIYPAARPAAACRAVLLATALPDPNSLPDLPSAHEFRQVVRTVLKRHAQSNLSRVSPESYKRLLDSRDGDGDLRGLLLDFVADFAVPGNARDPSFVSIARDLTREAWRLFGSEHSNLVIDPFAGGGAIPAEASRLGFDVVASDLNPVALTVNEMLLKHAPSHRDEVAAKLIEFATWSTQQLNARLAALYPTQKNETPVTYLWARTIWSRQPGAEFVVEIPLLRSMALTRNRRGGDWYLQWERDHSGAIASDEHLIERGGEVVRLRRPRLVIKRGGSAPSGTIRKGSATCPITGQVTPVGEVRTQLAQHQGGARTARLYAVVIDTDAGRVFRAPTKQDTEAAAAAGAMLSDLLQAHPDIQLSEPLPREGTNGFRIQKYGMTQWRDVFTDRQLLVHLTMVHLQREYLSREVLPAGMREALHFATAILIDRLVDLNSSLCGWQLNTPNVAHTFVRWALPMVFDFGEINPLAAAGGSAESAASRIASAIKEVPAPPATASVEVMQADASALPLPNDAAAILFTDPPYYDAIPYSDLLDYFAVWLRLTLPARAASWFRAGVSPKDEECVVDRSKGKDFAFFTDKMTAALKEARRVVAEAGVGVVVFAHKSTRGWEAQLQSLLNAGWVITASWPLDTEMASRLRARNSAALASSVHLICRPRETADTSADRVGQWRDVLAELPRRIHQWMPRLAAERVVGADAIFACLGPALEIFSQYERVDKANGDAVQLGEYLEHVWAAVAREALSMVLASPDTLGLEPDGRLTAIWLWTLASVATTGGPIMESTATPADVEDEDEIAPVVAAAGFVVEFDAARKIAQGLGARLDELPHMVEIKGDKARLLSVVERTRYLFGSDSAPTAAVERPNKKQLGLFATIDAVAIKQEWGDLGAPQAGKTTLDRIHQAMLLFAAGRGEALRRFIVEEGIGSQPQFWKLAQALSALYPTGTDEKRWIDGVLARKKSFGFA